MCSRNAGCVYGAGTSTGNDATGADPAIAATGYQPGAERRTGTTARLALDHDTGRSAAGNSSSAAERAGTGTCHASRGGEPTPSGRRHSKEGAAGTEGSAQSRCTEKAGRISATRSASAFRSSARTDDGACRAASAARHAGQL